LGFGLLWREWIYTKGILEMNFEDIGILAGGKVIGGTLKV
jgi:hypothetical protein